MTDSSIPPNPSEAEVEEIRIKAAINLGVVPDAEVQAVGEVINLPPSHYSRSLVNTSGANYGDDIAAKNDELMNSTTDALQKAISPQE